MPLIILKIEMQFVYIFVFVLLCIVFQSAYGKFYLTSGNCAGHDIGLIVEVVKVSFAKERKLLGYFVWQVPNDDNWLLSQTAGMLHFYQPIQFPPS